MADTFYTAEPPQIRVSFEAADLDPNVNTVTLYRYADGQVYPVRTATDIFAIGGFVADDTEVPLGVHVDYRALQFDVGGHQLGYSVTVGVDVPAPAPQVAWISDPLNASSAIQVVMTDTAGVTTPRSVSGTLYTSGPNTLVLSGDMSLVQGADMGFYTLSASDDERILELLRSTNGQILIRTGPAFGVLTPRLFYCFAGKAAPLFQGPNGSAWANTVDEITVTTLAVQSAGATWTDLQNLFTTWEQVESAYATWLDLEENAPRG